MIGGFTFPFYGQVYEGVSINTNGGMTFGGGVPDYDVAAGEVAFPTIAVFWGDLDPSRHGAEDRPRQLRWWQYESCFEVRYQMLQDYDEPTHHDSATVLLADDGVIGVEHGTVRSEDVMVGVFDGTHLDDRRLEPAEEFVMSHHGTGIILYDSWHDLDDRH